MPKINRNSATCKRFDILSFERCRLCSHEEVGSVPSLLESGQVLWLLWPRESHKVMWCQCGNSDLKRMAVSMSCFLKCLLLKPWTAKSLTILLKRPYTKGQRSIWLPAIPSKASDMWVKQSWTLQMASYQQDSAGWPQVMLCKNKRITHLNSAHSLDPQIIKCNQRFLVLTHYSLR